MVSFSHGHLKAFQGVESGHGRGTKKLRDKEHTRGQQGSGEIPLLVRPESSLAACR